MIGVAFFLLLVSAPVDGYLLGDMFSEGRVRITDFEVPNIVNAGETFSIDITIRNDRFLSVTEMVRIDLFDGLLELIKKNVGEELAISLPGRTTQTITINCLVREGDIDWYKEEYNVQALLFQKIPIVGWVSRDVSTVQGIHVQSQYSEKDKVRILSIEAPEILDEEETMFDVTVTVSNEGAFDVFTEVYVDMVEKPSVIPELEQYDILRGLASELKELGKSTEERIRSGEIREFKIACSLRETELNKEKFNIEALLYVNLNGEHFNVDTSTMLGIHHTQPYLEQNYLFIIAAVFGILLALILIVLIVRILYPSYYIKKIKLKEEKQRIDKRNE